MSDVALDEAPGSKTITIEWHETARCKATIPLDLVREMFGLGGTPDEEMEARVAVMAANFASLMRRLEPHVTEERRFDARIKLINGTSPAGI